jgi:hypothetical protein
MVKLSGGATNWLYLASWVPEKLYAGLSYRQSKSFHDPRETEEGKNLPVAVRAILEANLNLLGSKAITIVLPLGKPSRNTVVDALEQLAGLV